MKYLIALAFCLGLAAAGTYEKPPIAFIEDLEVDPHARIIDGQVAVPGQFPHQVVNRPGGSFCGASLICNNWVLTAAHCAQGASLFNLYFGSVNQSQAVEPGRVRIDTRVKYVHPNYNPGNLNNDIALLLLPQNVSFTDRIKAIPLATHRTGVNKTITVSGWGRTSQSSGVSPVLRYVNLNTISNDDCKKVYGSSVVVNGTLCCKGNPHHSTCNGDSGGPLIERDPRGRLVQAGVVSFVHAAGCASGNPSGYIRVESFLPWIKQTIGKTCNLP